MTISKASDAVFSHPLARGARIWKATGRDGSTQRLLVVVTTLVLDEGSKKFKAEMVGRLRETVQHWLAEHQDEAEGFMLVNRLRDWHD